MPAAQLIATGLANYHNGHPQTTGQKPRPNPADFFLDDRSRVHVAGRPLTVGDQTAGRVDLRRKRPLDVHCTSTRDASVLNRGVERRKGPPGGVSHGHVIEMGVEHHGRRQPAAAHAADHIARLVNADLIIANRDHLVAHNRGGLAFLARKTFDANQSLQKVDAG
jgi:hypothetical protein